MGNCCSASSKKDTNFSTPGRTLGSAGGATAAGATAGPGPAPAPAVQPASPRATLPSNVITGATGAGSAAARAAEARAASSAAAASKGKLAANLAEQKKLTQTDTLRAAATDVRVARDQDASVSALRHD